MRNRMRASEKGSSEHFLWLDGMAEGAVADISRSINRII